MANKKCFIIGDDHVFVRMGLKQTILNAMDAEVLEAQNGKEVIKLLQNHNPDLLILDISMPGKDGLDILKDVKAINAKVPVLMLSAYSEEQYALRAFRSGAYGYLTKDKSPSEIINAIQVILRGEKYLSPSLAHLLVKEITGKKEKELHSELSDKEYSVFIQIGSGKTVSEIAEEQMLSVKTISTYRTRILQKMGFKNNAEIMQYVVSKKLTER